MLRKSKIITSLIKSYIKNLLNNERNFIHILNTKVIFYFKKLSSSSYLQNFILLNLFNFI
jgi:hypothetical protein